MTPLGLGFCYLICVKWSCTPAACTIPWVIIVLVHVLPNKESLFLPCTVVLRSTWNKFLNYFCLAPYSLYFQHYYNGTVQLVAWWLLELCFFCMQGRMGSSVGGNRWQSSNEKVAEPKYLLLLESVRPWFQGSHHVVARWEGGGGRRFGTWWPCTPSGRQIPSPPGRRRPLPF